MKRWLIIVLASCACVAAPWWLYLAWYRAPMQEMSRTLRGWHSGKDQMQRTLGQATRIREELSAIESTTLGPTGELAEHRLRALLTELCGTGGLAEFVIACREPKAVANPAAGENPVEFTREQRRKPDFLTIETSVTGRGSLEACMRTAALLEAQPWLHRVSGVSIQPRGKERREFDLTAQVVTIVMPDLSTPETGAHASVAPAQGSEWLAVAARNPFVPAADPPLVLVAASPEIETSGVPQQPPRPLSEWMVTGLMRTSGGGEAILSNTRTGESLVVAPGREILGLIVSAVSTGEIVVTEGEAGYRVALGRTLAEREAVLE